MRSKIQPKLYYSITEVAEMTNLKPHVLRYWETEFKNLRPKKNRAGNRAYRISDIKLIEEIKRLLYEEGYTIAGARKKLLEKKSNPAKKLGREKIEETIRSLREDLLEIKRILESE